MEGDLYPFIGESECIGYVDTLKGSVLCLALAWVLRTYNPSSSHRYKRLSINARNRNEIPQFDLTIESSPRLPLKHPLSNLKNEDPDPRAPTLNVTMDTPTTIRHGEAFNVLVNVTYSSVGNHSASTSAASKSPNVITFHTDLFDEAAWPSPFELYRKRARYDYWEPCEEEEDRRCGAFMIYADDPDNAVSVGSSDKFVDLSPGETWTSLRTMHETVWSYLPGEPKEGDLFRCVFGGGRVDWWDWGSKEEHLDTIVMMPAWGFGSVREPWENDGRPKLVVPGSDSPDIYFKE